MLKKVESIYQKDVTVLNVTILNRYAPNHRASKYMKQKLIELEGEMDKSIIILGDFKPPSQ